MDDELAMHRLRHPLTIVAFALIVAGCSAGGDGTPAVSIVGLGTTSTAPERSATDQPATTDTTLAATSSIEPTTTLPPIPRQPLTGQPLSPGEAPIPRPALAVKIDNAPAARRNHSGLAVADIVFEEIVEAEITRFAAVFHSQGSERVGPVRSGRSQDVDLLTSFGQPLFAWSGGNPGVEGLITASSLVDLNATRGAAGFYRGPGSAPHNLYSSTLALWLQTPAGHPGAPPQQFGYVRPGEVFVGDPSRGFRLAMRSIDVEWTWDAAAARFVRSQEGRAHDDAVHGRIGATNVVVMVVAYRPSRIDARSPEAQTLSESAPLWVFSEGKVRAGRWIRTDPNAPFRFVDESGAPILLTPGNTWVELAEALPTDDPGNPAVALTVLP